MKLVTIPYKAYEEYLPQSGKFILSQSTSDSLTVYQAFNPAIAKYAVAHQKFGGAHYSFGRMSWIKPNFLWMMYRSGWASKIGQEKVLAIKISRTGFEEILKRAVHASYKENIYQTRENWKAQLATSAVRLQWDPDHGPRGNNLARKAIQLGLKGDILRTFNEKWILSIEDITDFVIGEKNKLDNGNRDALLVIKEEVVEVDNENIRLSLGLDVL